MTIQVAAPGSAPVPASPAQITSLQASLGITPGAITSVTAQQLINANSQLGGLAAPVQTLLNAQSVSDRNRVNHTNFDPASNVNVVLPGTGAIQTLQAYINQLEIRLTALGSTAPVNTVQPTAPTGTLTVNSTLIAVTGTWTGASTYVYVWYRVNATTGLFTATGGTASTYPLGPLDAGSKMACSIAGVSSTGVTAAAVMSAVTTSAVGVTLPTISVAPAVTPSGTQSVDTLLTTTNGTWNNASGATYTYQWTFNSAAITGAIANTYTIASGEAGGSIVCLVLATTTQGSAASAASSNTITVASTATLTQISAPALPTLTSGVPATVTPSVWNITPDSARTQRFYVSQGTGGLTTPYALITNGSQYTPTDDAFMTSQTGLSTLVGATVYVDEQVTYQGVTYTSTKSTGQTVQAVSATFTLTLAHTGISWTQSTAITAVSPAVASGGTAPYSLFITSGTTALPAGLTMSSTGAITGTPTVFGGSVTYSISATDSAGHSAGPVTFTATVAQAGGSGSGVTLIQQIYGDMPVAQMSGMEVQALGGDVDLASLFQSGSIGGCTQNSAAFASNSGYIGITAAGTVTCPTSLSAGGTTTLRFGLIPDPANSARKVFFMGTRTADGTTFDHQGRVEIGLSETVAALNKSGTTYWLTSEIYIPTVRWNNGGGGATITQIHNSNQYSVATGPALWVMDNTSEVFPNPGMLLSRIQQPINNSGHSYTETYPFASNNSGFGPNSVTDGLVMPNVTFPLNTWVQLIMKYRGDPTGTTGLLAAWWSIGGVITQLMSETNITIGTNDTTTSGVEDGTVYTGGTPVPDYVKTGLDDFELGGGTAGVWELRRSMGLYQDNGNTVQQIQAAMP